MPRRRTLQQIAADLRAEGLDVTVTDSLASALMDESEGEKKRVLRYIAENPERWEAECRASHEAFLRAFYAYSTTTA